MPGRVGCSNSGRLSISTLALLALAVVLGAVGPGYGQDTPARRTAPAGAGEDAIYAYTDDTGRLVYVQSLSEVPPWLRQQARRVDREPAADSDIDALFEALGARDQRGAVPVVYRYRARSGRPVYTNLPQLVPPGQREAARVDLSRVSLHTQLGTELGNKLDAEHARLTAAPHCAKLRSDAAQGLLRKLWNDHAPLLPFGAAILAFIVLTPYMLRRVDGRQWARTLSMAIPALAVAALVTYGTLESARALDAIKTLAAPCEPATWQALRSGDQNLVERLHLLQGLRVQQAGLEAIAREGRE